MICHWSVIILLLTVIEMPIIWCPWLSLIYHGYNVINMSLICHLNVNNLSLTFQWCDINASLICRLNVNECILDMSLKFYWYIYQYAIAIDNRHWYVIDLSLSSADPNIYGQPGPHSGIFIVELVHYGFIHSSIWYYGNWSLFNLLFTSFIVRFVQISIYS